MIDLDNMRYELQSMRGKTLLIIYCDHPVDVDFLTESLGENIENIAGDLTVLWLPTDARIEVYTDDQLAEIGLKRIGQ